jgi:hypothetical protein
LRGIAYQCIGVKAFPEEVTSQEIAGAYQEVHRSEGISLILIFHFLNQAITPRNMQKTGNEVCQSRKSRKQCSVDDSMS